MNPELYRIMDILYEWMQEERKTNGATPLHKAISGAYSQISILVTQ